MAVVVAMAAVACDGFLLLATLMLVDLAIPAAAVTY